MPLPYTVTALKQPAPVADPILAGTVAFRWTFPANWPSGYLSTMWAKDAPGQRTEIRCNGDGPLSLHLFGPTLLREVHFQRVRPASVGTAGLAIAWDENGADMFIAGGRLVSLEEAGNAVVTFDTEPLSVVVGTLSFPTEALKRLDKADWLFVRTLMDVSERLASDDPYVLLRLSSLLRQLLLDGEPLMDRVNRTHRLRDLHFSVSHHAEEPPCSPELWIKSLNPDGGEKQSLTRDQFLQKAIIRFYGTDYTVHELIDAAAHKMGGVHIDEPRDDEQRRLLALEEVLSIMESSPVLFALRDCALVVVRGLFPLVEAIMKPYLPG